MTSNHRDPAHCAAVVIPCTVADSGMARQTAVFRPATCRDAGIGLLFDGMCGVGWATCFRERNEGDSLRMWLPPVELPTRSREPVAHDPLPQV
jgi:hypothetical protein